MPWTLEHMPAREEWEKVFKTKKEAVAELRNHICLDCMGGIERYVSSQSPSGFGVRKRAKPNPESAKDLLSTSCGCEYSLYRSDRKSIPQ
jgi:hypothetical protein